MIKVDNVEYILNEDAVFLPLRCLVTIRNKLLCLWLLILGDSPMNMCYVDIFSTQVTLHWYTVMI